MLKPIPESPSKGIGIAGYMGAGKTTIARYFGDRGARLIDADIQAKEFMNQSPVVRTLLMQTYGSAIIDAQGIDVQQLGTRVFTSPHDLLNFNRLLQPLLLTHFSQLIQQKPSCMWVMDAALIPFWGIESWFSKLIWVDAPLELRLKRLQQKRSLPLDILQNRMFCQQELFPPPPQPPWQYLTNDISLPDLHARLDALLADS